MPGAAGVVFGNLIIQAGLSVANEAGHELTLIEIEGTQRSSNESWNNAATRYWGVFDTIAGYGSYRGYFVSNHVDGQRDSGTLEGKVQSQGGEIIVEGTYQYRGGSGEFTLLSGGGTFKIRVLASRDVEIIWHGMYEIAAPPKPKTRLLTDYPMRVKLKDRPSAPVRLAKDVLNMLGQ